MPDAKGYMRFISRATTVLKNVPVLAPMAADAWRFARSPRATLSVLRDLAATRREVAFFRDLAESSGDRTALVLTVNDDSIYRLKLEAMLGAGLKMQGWRPVVVLDARARIQARRYFRAFGIDEFVYIEDFRLSRQELEQCAHEAMKFEARNLDLQDVKTWRFQDSWIGPQLISTLSRLRFEGMPDFANPAVRNMLLSELPRTLAHVMRAHKLVGRYPAAIALVNEANYATFGPLVDVCVARGIDVIQFIQPWRDDALIFRRLTPATRRDHPGSVSRETLDMLTGLPWTYEHQRRLDAVFADRYSGKWFLQARNQKNTRTRSRPDLIKELGLEPAKKIAVVFSHLLWDGNLFYGEDLFKDFGDWFVQTIRAACANRHLNWIVKLHPANVWKRSYEGVKGEYAEVDLIRKYIGDLPEHVKLMAADTDISTYSLFQCVDYGVTVRGTAGMELSCFGVPCVTAGTGRYSELGFTVDSRSAEEYLGHLARLHERPPLRDIEKCRAKWHAYAAFVLRPWTMQSFRSEFAYRREGNQPLDHNLSPTVRSLAEVRAHSDLLQWAKWVESKAIDYLHEVPEAHEPTIPNHTIDYRQEPSGL